MLDQIINFFLVNAAVVLPAAVVLALIVSSTARRGMKTLLRILARPLLIAAVIALVYDGTRTMAGNSGLVITSLEAHWATLLPKTYEITKAWVATRIHPLAWANGVAPVIRLPSWLVMGILGLFLAWIGQRRREQTIFVN